MIVSAARICQRFTLTISRLSALSPKTGQFVIAASSCWRFHKTAYFARFYHEVHLTEDEMEESFIKGWGKGGQKVNKSSNCVHLKHKPTGIIIKCHESRSLARNRVIAREILRQKLDFLYNGKESELAQAVAKKKKKKANYARKRRLREEAIATGLQNVKDGPADSCDV